MPLSVGAPLVPSRRGDERLPTLDHQTTIGELLRSAEEAGAEVVDLAGRREDGTPEWVVTAVRGERAAEFLELVEWFLDDQRPTLAEQELLLKAFLARWSGSTLFSARELEMARQKPLPVIEREKSGSVFCWFERRAEGGWKRREPREPRDR